LELPIARRPNSQRGLRLVKLTRHRPRSLHGWTAIPTSH